MTQILVDTSVLIHAQRDPEFAKHLDHLSGRLVISRVTASEFIYGSRNVSEKKRNKLICDLFPVLEINEEVSKRSYQLLDKYILKVKLSIPDALIAATAIEHRLLLWTENIKHFQVIDGVRLYSL